MIITPLLVIFMIVVFVLVFLFVSTIDKRKWLVLLVSVVLTPLVYFFVFYPIVNIVSNYHHQKYFDSEAWKEKPALRYEMIDHSVETNYFVGKTKSEMTSLLGTYEWLSWDDALKAHDDNKWNYGLGMEPGAFTEHRECVEIIFENDTVKALKPFKEKINFDGTVKEE